MRICCLDGSPVAQIGIKHVLTESGFDVVATSASPSDILASIKENPVELLVSEMRMGDVDILDLVEPLQEFASGTRLLIYTFQTNPTYVARAAAWNVYDYVLKRFDTSRLVQSVSLAITGTPASDSLVTRARQFLSSPAFFRDELGSRLTRRESQILVHLSLGFNNRDIAVTLRLSTETVKEHVQNIFKKLKVHDRTEAAVWALRNGVPRFEIDSPASR
jgi:DNA-binding NarL/FixJ family response regulator